ncbi:MAG TPA: hemolysin family protein [Thermodesulfobacteriota bacterium]|nr:hemolysin family protein [Thermodesulfobacteriota bacterium]
MRLFLIFVLFWGLVFFASSEASLFSLGRLRLARLKEEGNPSHPVIERLLRHPRRLIISILIGNEALNVAISSLASALFIGLWGDSAKWLAIPAVLLGIILLGEVLPKTIAVRDPERTSAWVARPVARYVEIVGPVHWVVRKVVDGLFWLARVRPETASASMMEEDFKEFTETSVREGAVEESEKDFIHRVFKFSDQTVRTVMTPRSAVFTLPLETRIGEAVDILRENRFSRIPVYRNSKEEIVGVLYAKDLLRVRRQRSVEERDLRAFLRKPHFIPLSMKLNILFQELQKKRIHLAVVVDEYGKMAGIVTLEDLLEELFGEIYDELDRTRRRRGLEAMRGRGERPGAQPEV